MNVVTITDPNHPLLFRLTARIMRNRQSVPNWPPQMEALTHWLDSTRKLPSYRKWPHKKLFEKWLEWWKVFPPPPSEQDTRQLMAPLPTWRETHQQWKAILNSFGHLYYNPTSRIIYTCTPHITLSGENNDYDVGRFHVGVVMEEHSPLSDYTHSSTNGDRQHPHLYHEANHLCLGTAEIKAHLYLQRGLIFPLWLLLYQQLKEFNPNSQVNPLGNDDDEESSCDTCGDTGWLGNFSACERCGANLCDKCQFSCSQCGTVCEQHFSGYCSDCGEGYCTRHEVLTNCQICEQPFCEGCSDRCHDRDCRSVTCTADSKGCAACGNTFCSEHIRECVVNLVRDLYCLDCIEELKERKGTVDEIVPTPHYVVENQVPLPLG